MKIFNLDKIWTIQVRFVSFLPTTGTKPVRPICLNAALNILCWVILQNITGISELPKEQERRRMYDEDLLTETLLNY